MVTTWQPLEPFQNQTAFPQATGLKRRTEALHAEANQGYSTPEVPATTSLDIHGIKLPLMHNLNKLKHKWENGKWCYSFLHAGDHPCACCGHLQKRGSSLTFLAKEKPSRSNLLTIPCRSTLWGAHRPVAASWAQSYRHSPAPCSPRWLYQSTRGPKLSPQAAYNPHQSALSQSWLPFETKSQKKQCVFRAGGSILPLTTKKPSGNITNSPSNWKIFTWRNIHLSLLCYQQFIIIALKFPRFSTWCMYFFVSRCL